MSRTTPSGNTARKCESCHGEKVHFVDLPTGVVEVACENCNGRGMIYPETNRYKTDCCGRLHPASKLFFRAGLAICNHPDDCGNTNRRNRG